MYLTLPAEQIPTFALMPSTNLHFLREKLFHLITLKSGSKSLPAALSEVLHLSKSAVYDRINGNKQFSLQELLLLTEHFAISLDELQPPQPGKLIFEAASIARPVNNCEVYLKELYGQVAAFSEIPDLKVWFSTPSLPFFYHMFFRELALFKLFVYARINWQLPYTERLVFDPDTFPENYLYDRYMQPIASNYTSLATIEFWSDELFYHTLKQMNYFIESGQLRDKQVISTLVEQLSALCYHLEEMAKKGKKSALNDRSGKHGEFGLYYNEIAPASLSLLLESSQVKCVFTVLDDPNFMVSHDHHLYHYTHQWMLKLRDKSNYISLNAEKDRRSYFNRLQNNIDHFRSQVLA